ncbi:hypothetical protein MZH49_20510, partial [Escherichia coli]|nr:hypothetical protein [Escherichia coli]
MNINYPAEYEIGDIVFTCIGAAGDAANL